MFSVWLLLLPFSLAKEVIAGFSTISYHDLSNQGQDKREFFVNSLTVDGILEISNVPQLAVARRTAFAAVHMLQAY